MEFKRYLDCYIDTETCNLRCQYCYIALLERFHNHLYLAEHSPEEVRKALSLDRLGGVCLINLCAGGETLLSPEVVPLIKALVSEGHYLMIVTNGTVTKRLEEIRERLTEEELKRLFFKFSFHYAELKRLKIMNRYFENIRMMRSSGCAFTCELTTSDDLIPEIDQIKEIVKSELGDYCHVTIARDDRTRDIKHLSSLSWEDYMDTWKSFHSSLFDFKTTIFSKKRKEFCYAGDWTLYVNLSTGEYRPCNCGRVLGNIYDEKELNFCAIGRCELPHCYNGHSWLVLGAIPQFTDVTYADERDRIGLKNEHWLNPEFREAFQTKLEHTNQQYSSVRKGYVFCKNFVLRMPRRIQSVAGRITGR